MARMISEQEKRQKRFAQKRAQQISTLQRRGYSTQDAEKVVDNLQAARTINLGLSIARDVGCSSATIKRTEETAREAITEACQVALKYEGGSKREVLESVVNHGKKP